MSDSKYPSDQQDRFLVRMPDGMRDRIAEAAKKNNRSMNAEIVARLEESFSGQAQRGLPAEILAALERLFDEKLGQRAYIDDSKGGRMDELKLPPTRARKPRG